MRLANILVIIVLVAISVSLFLVSHSSTGLFALNLSGPATYYIDFANGNDSSDGLSAATAWKHAPGDVNATGVPALIGKNNQILPGTVLKFKGGVFYKGSICWGGGQTYCGSENSPTPQGTESARITLSGDSWPGLEGTKAIIDGSEDITGWKKCESQDACGNNSNWQHLYYAYTTRPSYLDIAFPLSANLTQNDLPLSAAQYPDTVNPLYPDYSNFLQVTHDKVTATSITDTRLQQFGNDLIGKYIYLWINPNEVVIRSITGYNQITSTITFPTSNVYSDRNTLYAIVNLASTGVLDAQGEYFIDENAQNGLNKVILWPLNEQNLETSGTVTHSVRNAGIVLWSSTASNVTIEGFKIQKQTDDQYCGGVGVSGGDYPVNYSNATIKDNEITLNRGGSCANIIFFANNLLVENNYLHDNGGDNKGIQVEGDQVIVRDNTIDNIGGTGIYFPGATNSAIIGNTILNDTKAHSNGISTYQNSTNILVAGNYVDNSNSPYTLEQSSNITIINNIFLGGTVDVWSNVSNSLMTNNIFFPGYVQPFLDNNSKFYNNIFLDGTSSSTGTPGDIGVNDIRARTQDNNYAVDLSKLFVSAPRLKAVVVDSSLITSFPATTIYLVPEYYKIIQPGDILLFQDNIPRTITLVSKNIFSGNTRTFVTFTPGKSSLAEESVEVWPAGTTTFTADYHLKQGSIAIDTGTNADSLLSSAKQLFPYYNFNKDFGGNDRPQGSTWDIGAYEFETGQVTCTSFTYSAWSACINSSQTRTITTSSPSGCTGGAAITTQSCSTTSTQESTGGGSSGGGSSTGGGAPLTTPTTTTPTTNLCTQDSDCGITQATGNPYCTKNLITQNYQTPTCIDSGTPTAHCTTTIKPQTITTCDTNTGCANGTCLTTLTTTLNQATQQNTDTENATLGTFLDNPAATGVTIIALALFATTLFWIYRKFTQ